MVDGGRIYFLLLPSNCFCYVVDVDFRALDILDSLKCFFLRNFDVLVCLLYKSQHRLLLQSN